MTPNEEEIVALIEKLQQQSLSYDERKTLKNQLTTLLENLQQQSLGKYTSAFVGFMQAKGLNSLGYGQNDIKLRILLEQYIHATENTDKKHIHDLIDQELQNIYNHSLYPASARILPAYIGKIIRAVYLSKNQDLISLFKMHLPTPPARLFLGYDLPEDIAAKEKIEQATVAKFIRGNNGTSREKLESVIRMIQRKFRSKKRRQEEMTRLKKAYPKWVDDELAERSEPEIRDELIDASTPYRPRQCTAELADRIMNAAKKVTLFTDVRHLTAADSLGKIFDDCLYGRRTLSQSFLPFRPASLFAGDIKNGDDNVICCGPHEIDPRCLNGTTAEITFEVDKLKENPCAFYKQLDLCYKKDKTRQITIGNETLYFSHTKTISCIEEHHTNLQLFHNPDGQLAYYSQLPNHKFISYNLPEIQQILTLNFFRFIDTLCDDSRDTSNESAKRKTRDIYEQISNLTEEELVDFLRELGIKMTDTCEFNFYGAYQVDFNAIKAIGIYNGERKVYSLNLRQFIVQLQDGNFYALEEAKSEIPQLFASNRFINFLISKIDNKDIVNTLLALKRQQQASVREFSTTPSFSLYRQQDNSGFGIKPKLDDVKMECPQPHQQPQ